MTDKFILVEEKNKLDLFKTIRHITMICIFLLHTVRYPDKDLMSNILTLSTLLLLKSTIEVKSFVTKIL